MHNHIRMHRFTRADNRSLMYAYFSYVYAPPRVKKIFILFHIYRDIWYNSYIGENPIELGFFSERTLEPI